MKKAYFTLLTASLIAFGPVFTLSQSGETYVIQKSVIAGGGGKSSSGTVTIDGTLGQGLAGTVSASGILQHTVGFWGGGSAPASIVSISGRVFTSDAITGLRNAIVSLTDPVGTVRTTTTSSFGFYSFDNVVPGGVYTIRITSRRFRYQPMAVSPSADLTGVDFVGLE